MHSSPGGGKGPLPRNDRKRGAHGSQDLALVGRLGGAGEKAPLGCGHLTCSQPLQTSRPQRFSSSTFPRRLTVQNSSFTFSQMWPTSQWYQKNAKFYYSRDHPVGRAVWDPRGTPRESPAPHCHLCPHLRESGAESHLLWGPSSSAI